MTKGSITASETGRALAAVDKALAAAGHHRPARLPPGTRTLSPGP